jgi:hypothetical protein
LSLGLQNALQKPFRALSKIYLTIFWKEFSKTKMCRQIRSKEQKAHKEKCKKKGGSGIFLI